MVGGFYSDEQIDQSVNFALGSEFEENLGGAARRELFGPNPLQLLHSLTPGGDPGRSGRHQHHQPVPAGCQELRDLHSITRSRLPDGLELTLGARYSWEEKIGRIHPDRDQ